MSNSDRAFRDMYDYFDKSVNNIGNLFQSGIQTAGGSSKAYRPLAKKSHQFDAALHTAGQRFVSELQSRFDQQGPGWEGIAETTRLERHRDNSSSMEPLLDTGEMKKAIKYEVHNSTLEVGVDDGRHSARDLNFYEGMTISALFELNEIGFTTPSGSRYPGQNVPARPVFVHEETIKALHEIAAEFAEHVLTGPKGRLVTSQKARGT